MRNYSVRSSLAAEKNSYLGTKDCSEVLVNNRDGGNVALIPKDSLQLKIMRGRKKEGQEKVKEALFRENPPGRCGKHHAFPSESK